MRTMKPLAWSLVLSGLLCGAPAEAGFAGKLLGRGVSGQSLSSKVGQKAARSARRLDIVRDRATPARPLPRPRSAVRYTTRERAVGELGHGIPPGRHMAPAHRGRPLSPEAAQRRFGLPAKPEVRMGIRVPSGQPIRHNKALRGGAGVPEWTSTKRIPRDAIRTVTPLRSNAKQGASGFSRRSP